jgi:hypothetical protein
MVWRADPRTAGNLNAKLVKPITSRVFFAKCGDPPAGHQKCEWSVAAFEALKELMSGAVR